MRPAYSRTGGGAGETRPKARRTGRGSHWLLDRLRAGARRGGAPLWPRSDHCRPKRSSRQQPCDAAIKEVQHGDREARTFRVAGKAGA